MRSLLRTRVLVASTLLLGVAVGLSSAPALSAGGTITSRGPAAAATYASDSTTSLTLALPTGAQIGDVLIASLGFGASGATSQPILTAPAGWTLSSRTNHGADGTLAVYWHVLASGETTYTWTTNFRVGGAIFLAAFAGVDTTQPIDVAAGASVARGTSASTPSVTTTAANDALVASYFGYRSGGAGTTWAAPAAMTELGDATNGGSRSGSMDYAFQASAGASGAETATASGSQDYAVATLSALRPAGGTSDTTPPVISGVAAGSVTTTGASISWATDEASDSQVEYGTTTGYGSSTAIDSTAVVSHSRSLSGLTAGTLYHYRVKSRDSAGNLASSPDFTFQTTTAADTTPPVISGVAAGSVTSTGASVSWSTDEASDSQVEYGTTTGYGSSSAIDSTAVLNHSRSLAGLAAGTLYHYRVKSRDAAGNLATSGDFTFQTSTTGGSAGPADTFDSNTLDPARWIATPSGSTVAALNQELEITHPAGAWTKGMLQSATPHDQTGKSLQIQVKRAANGALGGATFGETTIFLWLDATHYVSFFMAGGSLTARVNTGSGEVNLNPAWPAYNAANMQWLRFREASGTLYWEYASGATSPGTWTVLASRADPFALSAVTLRIVAGANTSSADTAKFDNVSTS
ncbi:MAG: hypothetical protein QOH00_695 [Gaiellales bacterium]|nr:hypothetical protein [Gaiellales bacterium]